MDELNFNLPWMIWVTVWLASLSINLYLLRRRLDDERRKGRR